MLKEVYASQFASHVGDDRHIRFHKGLNVVLGGEQAENSIGKSTLLMIVDYAFGGDAFGRSDAVKEYAVDNHEIFFTHEFVSGERFFSRDTAQPTRVNEYENGAYSVPSGSMRIGDFRELLKEESGLEDPDLTWREAVGPFMRVSESHEINYGKPLNSSSRAADANGVKALEQLFAVFQSIKQLEVAASDAIDRYKVMRNAAELGLSEYISLRSRRERNRAQTQLNTARRELYDLKLGADQKLFEDGIAASEHNLEIKAQLTELRQKRDILTAKIGVIDRGRTRRYNIDIQQVESLRQFFPGVDLGRLEEIEHFHQRLTEILGDELESQKEQYRLMLNAVDGQINQLRTQLADMGQSSTLSTEEWDKAGELNGTIQRLQARIDAWDKTEELKSEKQRASDELQERRPLIIERMTDGINTSLKRLNDEVDAGSNPPELHIAERRNGKQTYTFGTERDTGAGTRAKDVILLDLVLLRNTNLPVLIHDSTLLKNIGDDPIENIMRLYAETDAMSKQVFIAFDKKESYSPETQRIIDDHAVVSLSAGKRSLYGRRWNMAEGSMESTQTPEVGGTMAPRISDEGTT